MIECIFSNLSDVDNLLNNIDIYVPPRSQGRKTEHTERYSIIKFISHFKNELFVSFPARIIHSDKPDFRLLTQVTSIGIEITESIPEQLAMASSLLEKHFPEGSILEPEFFEWNAPDRTEEEILEILKKSNKHLIGKGYAGKSIEDKWIYGISGCINKKALKLNKVGFDKFDKNWLLIYDNQIKSFIDKDYLLANFPLVINDYFNNNFKYFFDKIIIDCSNFFYIINSNNNHVIES